MNKSRAFTMVGLILAAHWASGAGLAPQEFVATASAAGQAGLDLSRLALDKSQSPPIRAFAQKMIDDHGRIRTELATLARTKGLQLAGPTAAQRAQLAELRKKAGAEFDAACARQMVADQDDAVLLFSAAGTLEDTQLAEFARKTLPVLTQNQEIAQHLVVAR